MISDRTVRRFREDREVAEETLLRLVELTRYCPSGRNAQPLRYLPVTSDEEKGKVFPLLKWAGYFQDWDGPEKGERPSAYLIQCLDTKYGKDCLCDEELGIDERYTPRYVLAIGYPAEEVRITDMPDDDDADFKYYRTADGVHHVPKRPLAQLIINTSNPESK